MKNLESRLFSKKRAKQLYLYALSRGDKTRAEKLKKFYNLDCKLENSINKLYEINLALGNYEKAQKIVTRYNLERNIRIDKNSFETLKLSNRIYNHFLDKQYVANIQMQQKNKNTQIISLISLNEKLDAHRTAKHLVAKTKISRKPDADYVYITSNPPFREYELMKNIYTNKALENTQQHYNKTSNISTIPKSSKILQTA